MPWPQILLLALQVLSALTPEIIAILQAIQAQGGTPTPAQSAKLVAYAAAHQSMAQGVQQLAAYHAS